MRRVPTHVVLRLLIPSMLLIPSASSGATNPPAYSGEFTISACYNTVNGQVRLVKPWGPSPDCVPPAPYAINPASTSASICTEGGAFDCKPSEYFAELNTQGPKGDKGEPGQKGDPGSKGDTGPQGVQGPAGEQGPQGYGATMSGPDAAGCYQITIVDQVGLRVPGSLVATVCNGARGEKGDTGLTGPKGDKGDKGDQGLPGIQGTPGVNGDKGDPGTPGAPGAGAVVTALLAGDPNCPTGGARIADGSGNVAYACSGGAAPRAVCTGDGVPGGTCSATTTRVCAYDKNCPSGETCMAPSPRLVDNGNGTVTDRRTCLMWEKKTGIPDYLSRVDCTDANVCPDPHNVRNAYTWGDGEDQRLNGTAATVFLRQLNDAAFAGHTDWRLPTSAGNAWDYPTGYDPELESIALGPLNYPGIDSIFGPAKPAPYWSSSLYAGTLGRAWCVSFLNGAPGWSLAGESWYVRAVRGGP